MRVEELVQGARDALSVKRVFGEPYERDGVTVIPVATFAGGGGGGGDNRPEGGSGGGFGIGAKPSGVYVIKGGSVSWQPAMDLNRIILGGQLVVLAALFVFRSYARSRAKIKKAKVKR